MLTGDTCSQGIHTLQGAFIHRGYSLTEDTHSQGALAYMGYLQGHLQGIFTEDTYRVTRFQGTLTHRGYPLKGATHLQETLGHRGHSFTGHTCSQGTLTHMGYSLIGDTC